MRGPPQRGEEIEGGWAREQLLRMDGDFVAAIERAITAGLERPRESAEFGQPLEALK